MPQRFSSGGKPFSRRLDVQAACCAAAALLSLSCQSLSASDITYLPIKEGWLHIAVTLALHSCAVVGYAVEAHLPASLPLAALQMAASRCTPLPGLLYHSDRGSHFASRFFQEGLARLRARGGMSRKGDCWDNAVSESCISSLERELFEEVIFESRAMARQAVFELIVVIYNRHRRHWALGYLRPLEFERQAAVT